MNGPHARSRITAAFRPRDIRIVHRQYVRALPPHHSPGRIYTFPSSPVSSPVNNRSSFCAATVPNLVKSTDKLHNGGHVLSHSSSSLFTPIIATSSGTPIPASLHALASSRAPASFHAKIPAGFGSDLIHFVNSSARRPCRFSPFSNNSCGRQDHTQNVAHRQPLLKSAQPRRPLLRFPIKRKMLQHARQQMFPYATTTPAW